MSEDKQPKKFDEGTDKRIHEHLSDEDDQISEDDIRNVRTDIEDVDVPEEETELPIADDTDNTDELETKDNLDPDVDTSSWEVLGS